MQTWLNLGASFYQSKKMNVFFDDIRDAPDDSWTVVRDPEVLKDMLVSGVVRNLSLDHDIQYWTESGVEVTGYTLLCYMEATGNVPKGRIFVHSQNPVGRMKMMVVIQRLGKD
jgi:hypothetical protein